MTDAKQTYPKSLFSQIGCRPPATDQIVAEWAVPAR